MKQIYSNEVDFQWKLLHLESWLRDRGYKSEAIQGEIQKVNLIDRNNLFKKCPKHHQDSINLVLTFHPVLNIIFDVFKEAALACTKVTCPKSNVIQASTYSFL